ncbi:RsfA family transcriptional regulator [Pseudogracilibacillus auburnensis]|uniref:Prespore-specific regulator n=1 Tax=Pseudogracilibacillus auburnensis TaxID=1494959 RepID=A0A2V3W0I9_9BACI|nr:RsfA family transcriptional regulator [Pseudogracilibacillus auburnensis]MBO1003425.1 RsfA family transcriptional regulator [Pseudogracilibacillus auburnensis]PXW86588.1 prespore-specific regulator [Pseudogracilibacillus auburnensis]
MAKVRQDAWSHEDDLLLAETVLRHIREGSTQLNAFEEVGDELNRTSAACGFRWNAEVRNKYIHAIDLAKRQRKERKRAQAKQIRKEPSITVPQEVENKSSLIMEPEEPVEMTLESVIHYLQSFQKDYYASNQVKNKAEKIQYENNELREDVSRLERELSITRKKLATVEEDYKVFIQIMERARKMTVLEDQGSSSSPTFKMDKNGNLEQLAHGSSN